MSLFRSLIAALHSPAMLGATTLLSACCVVAFYGYQMHPPLMAYEPPHVIFPSNGGPVLFPHGHHRQDSGAAIECIECHHKLDPEAKTAAPMKCRICHYNDPDIVETVCADDKTHPRCVGIKCNTCHDGEKCTFCHRKQP
ncbi:MAG: cytochrome c3 family protein [Chitinispirillaceae bacterium]|nr:cytochrome c3 family protein [Chitinispirillaceae bacterium]